MLAAVSRPNTCISNRPPNSEFHSDAETLANGDITDTRSLKHHAFIVPAARGTEHRGRVCMYSTCATELLGCLADTPPLLFSDD